MNGKAEIFDTWHEVGKTRDGVECACGCLNVFYRWSWAGHGKAQCVCCGAWIRYKTLEVEQAKERE